MDPKELLDSEKEDFIKGMVHTEFVYYYEDGDYINAMIAGYDPDKGLSCIATEEETQRDGWKSDNIDKDGVWCVVSFRSLDRIYQLCVEIDETGAFETSLDTLGAPTCRFS